MTRHISQTLEEWLAARLALLAGPVPRALSRRPAPPAA
jgi:hypothetical protein